MLANIVFQFFSKGGPVMWPDSRQRHRRRRRHRRTRVLVAARKPETRPAKNGAAFGRAGKWRCRRRAKISEGADDPVIRMIGHGLNHIGHRHASLLGALQLAAGIELKRAGRFLTVMDTLVTLAPLLGLLGTVTGLMRAFLNIGSAELSVTAVTGGIGEALIATACGLGIAIFALIPFNYFSARVTQLQFDLETAATNVEVMVGGGKAGDAVHLHQPSSPSQATSH